MRTHLGMTISRRPLLQILRPNSTYTTTSPSARAHLQGHVKMQAISRTYTLKSRPSLLQARISAQLSGRSCLIRSYYSEHHPHPQPYRDVEETILSSAMTHVPVHGFSTKSLQLGARDAGYLEVSIQLFPKGVFDLIKYHLVSQRQALKDRVQFPSNVRLGAEQKVRTLTIERLRANKDIIHQWQRVELVYL